MQKDESRAIGEYATILSLVEVGLGSLLHSFKIPFAGHFLAINQNAIMSRATIGLQSKKSALEISLVASLLKSLSPAGKKLTPMLAILTQGSLFSLGISLGGINLIGFFIAHTLSSLWGFIQPLLIIYFLFGENSLNVAQYYIKEFSLKFSGIEQMIFGIVLGLIILKILLSFLASAFIIKLSDEEFSSLQQKIAYKVKTRPNKNLGNPYFLALRDLFQPLFIISFFLTLIFFYFSHSSKAQLIWGLIRPLAFGYILFLAVRIFPIENLINLLNRRGHEKLASALDVAISKIKETKKL